MIGYQMELLLALRGYDTALFAIDDNDVNAQLAIRFESTDRDYVMRCVPIVVAIRRLKSFVDRHSLRSILVENERNCTGGLYLSAFARGIADTLDEFDRRLIVLAQMIELDKQLHISYLYAEVTSATKWWLHTLCDIIDIIEQSPTADTIGCGIISIVYSKWNRSISNDSTTALSRLLYRCHALFRHELLTWIVRGEVASNEFCIQQVDDPSLANPWQSYHLKQASIPCYIDADTATDLLFIGHAVKLISDQCTDSFKDDYAMKLQRSTLWNMEFEKIFADEHFCAELLSERIAECCSTTGVEVWQKLFPNGCDPLLKELQRSADIYFLGRANLWTRFADAFIMTILKPDASNVSTFANLSSEFNKCLTAIDSVDLTLDNVVLSIENANTIWKSIGITLRPLDSVMSLLLTDTFYSTCNRVWQILFRVYCLQTRLDRLFMFALRDLETYLTSTDLKRVWLIRAEMVTFVHCLQFFLHNDAIATLYTRLIRDLQHCGNLRNAHRLIETFRDEILTCCGLNAVMLYQCIEQILDVCWRICDMIDNIGTLDCVHLVSRADKFRHLSLLFYRSICDHKHVALHGFVQRLDFTDRFSRSLASIDDQS